MMDTHINLSNVGLQFNKEPQSVLQHVNLQVKRHEFVSIIGKSGCGKTSLLKMMAGLTKPSEGHIHLGGHPVVEPREEMTYVFQKPVLLEWRNVLENMLLPLELKHKITTDNVDQAREILGLVGMADHETKYPHECSGGMLSRASLARALLTNPEVLFMDEPFAALDAMTKEQLQIELDSISTQYNPTTIFITHDIQEAVFLSDRVILLGGSPANIIKEFTIPFSRPRQKELKFQIEFTQKVKEIYDHIELGNERV
jgi:NitT/TauT family transport system ATP-binding protein